MGVGRLAVALACLFATAPAGARAGGPPLAEPTPRLAWQELRFAARKAGLSAAINLRVGRESDGWGDGVVVESTTHLPGRTFVARERLDAADARARVIVDTETGAKNHRKTYTLGERGFRLELLEPASLPELMQPPDRWTKRTYSVTLFPPGLPAGATVTGPAGLLYALSAAQLRSPGDEMAIHVLVQTQVERVTVRVEGAEPVDFSFDENAGGRITVVREQQTALLLVARSHPVDPASASAFRIFGLEGDVQLVWDPARRIPVEISGHVKVLGQVTVRLASVTLP